MSYTADVSERSPVRIALTELIGFKQAGEALRTDALRVSSLDVGGHLSRLKGRGIEFDEARLYQEGDDLRTIDWRVTARTGKTHTKIFREERDRPVIIWLDLRQSMMFATQGAYKAVRAAQVAALLAWSAVTNGDRLGGLVFSEQEHVELRPRLGHRAALNLFRVLTGSAFWEPNQAKDALDKERSLLRLTRVARPGSQIFLLSDFRGLTESFEQHLRQLARHSDVSLLQFFDPIEQDLPPPGRYQIDMGGRLMSIDTNQMGSREAYRKRFHALQAPLEMLSRLPGIKLLECSTAADPHKLLTQYFETR